MRIGPHRPVDPDAIVAPQGYRVEALVVGLSFPSALSFGPGGELYLAESGGAAGPGTLGPGCPVALPRVLRIDPDQSVTEIGRLENPILGLVYRNGELLIGEDGPSPRILRVTAEGEVRVLVEGLPGGGDYGLSGLALDPSGALLFGLGTRTNSGVVGLDNLARGWPLRHPDWADVPGADLELAGVNYVTAQPALAGGVGAAALGMPGRRVTGAFKPYGVRSEPGERVRGGLRCGGAVYRMPLEAAEPERLAWGLRNPVGVRCAPDGRVFVTEGGMEERGSRPIAGAPDNFWALQSGGYYGWPDYASGIPVTDPRFRLPGHPIPRRLVNNAPPVSGLPAATFTARSGVGRFDFSTSEQFGFVGQALVALSGGWSLPAYPAEEIVPTGHRVVRVDPRSGEVTDFLVNRNALPASAGGSGGLERPFEVAFDPTGEVLYVVDFGEVRLSREHGLEPFGGTGVVWRITRIRPMLLTTRPAVQRAPRPEAPPVEVVPEAEEQVAGPPAEEVPGEAAPAGEEAPAVEPGPEPAPPSAEAALAETSAGAPPAPTEESPATAEEGSGLPTEAPAEGTPETPAAFPAEGGEPLAAESLAGEAEERAPGAPGERETTEE